MSTMMSEQRVAIIGAGLMGHGLAQVFAEAGASVAVHDPVPEVLASVNQRVIDNLKQLGRDLGAAARIRACGELRDAAQDAELVIEAGPEDLRLKRAIFAQLDQHASANAILATNTSVIPVREISAAVADRQRVIGTHWWNPPYLVPLVEVVQAEQTSAATVERTLALLQAAGKTPVHIKRDIPGFVGNRLQHALWREAVALVADGVCDAETLDTVVKQSFGLRLPVLGPLENADLVGLDLTLAIHEHVLPHINRTPAPSPYLRELVSEGKLGMRTGEGFRLWGSGEAERVRGDVANHLRFVTTHDPAVDSVGGSQTEERTT